MKNQIGAITIRIGHEQVSHVKKAAKKSNMSTSKLVGILAMDGAAKINAGKMAINQEVAIIEK